MYTQYNSGSWFYILLNIFLQFVSKYERDWNLILRDATAAHWSMEMDK